MAHKNRDLTTVCKKTGNRIWDFRIDRKRFTGSAGTPDKKVGERLAKAVWEQGRDEAAERRKAAARLDMKWTEACEDYFTWMGDYVTRERDRQQMEWVASELGEKLYVSQIDFKTLQSLVVKKRDQRCCNDPSREKISNATVNHMTKFVRKILKRCRIDLQCYLPNEPQYGKLMLKVDPRRREMMIEEEIKLRREAKPDLLDLSLFILYTGMRKTAAVELTWDQVSLIEGVINFTSKEKYQEIDIIPETEEILRRALKNKIKGSPFVWTWMAEKTWTEPRTGQLFVAGQRYRYSPMGAIHAWRRTCNRADLHNLNIHDLRKTLGARMIRETGSLRDVQLQLGHSNIGVTSQHYAHITPKDTAKRVMQTVSKSREHLEQAMREEAARSNRGPDNHLVA